MVKNQANSSVVLSNLFDYFSFIFLLRLFVYVLDLFEFVAKPAEISPPPPDSTVRIGLSCRKFFIFEVIISKIVSRTVRLRSLTAIEKN